MNESQEPNEIIESQFIGTVISSFKSLEGDVAARNQTIERNDEFIYGEEISKRIDIPVGHDFTPINWLRRTVEIHRSQFMGKGFTLDSTYKSEDINVEDEKEKKRLAIENNKKKSYAEARREVCVGIFKDNGAEAFWSAAAENASAVGDTVIKTWYDEKENFYHIEQVDSIENFYALWSRDDYKKRDAVAFVYQISKQEAIDLYHVDEDVQTSPNGLPFVIINSDNRAKYASEQEMVTILEVTGRIPGWKTDGKKNLSRCKRGKETEMNVIIVGDCIEQIIDNDKYIPKYYILPNKKARKRAWGIPDITKTAIEINITYIETFSDWRTLASKVNFQKYKAFGFPRGIQMPKPQSRKVEIIPLDEGQDIQPIALGQAAGLAEADFRYQLEECQNQFVREVGISRQLFDMPDTGGNSNPALLTAMKSVSDITNAKRELWSPIIKQIFKDALETLAKFNKDIKEIVSDEDWDLKVSFPSAMNADDPSYNSMQLNMFNTGVLSLQTLHENLGYDKQEEARIRTEMEDTLTAAIHGHQLALLATQKITPAGPVEPKVSINLRGDMTPEQEANLAYQKGINNGPFGSTSGPQGNAGMTAQANKDNAGYIDGKANPGGTSISRNQDGTVAPTLNSTVTPPINGPTDNREGVGIMSQPGSGATPVTAQGALAQQAQRQGA